MEEGDWMRLDVHSAEQASLSITSEGVARLAVRGEQWGFQHGGLSILVTHQLREGIARTQLHEGGGRVYLVSLS